MTMAINIFATRRLDNSWVSGCEADTPLLNILTTEKKKKKEFIHLFLFECF